MEIVRPQSVQPIPPHARRVFEGVLFDVYQWEQELFDGTKTIFEKIQRPDTVIVFPVLPNGNILLTKQEQPGKPPFIGGCGGRMDEGENPEEAARREMREETGYEADAMMLWNAQQPVGKIDWAVYTFIAKGVRRVGDMNLDAGEKIEVLEVSFEQLLQLAREDTFSEREIVPHLLAAQLDPVAFTQLRSLFNPTA